MRTLELLRRTMSNGAPSTNEPYYKDLRGNAIIIGGGIKTYLWMKNGETRQRYPRPGVIGGVPEIIQIGGPGLPAELGSNRYRAWFLFGTEAGSAYYTADYVTEHSDVHNLTTEEKQKYDPNGSEGFKRLYTLDIDHKILTVKNGAIIDATVTGSIKYDMLMFSASGPSSQLDRAFVRVNTSMKAIGGVVVDDVAQPIGVPASDPGSYYQGSNGLNYPKKTLDFVCAEFGFTAEALGTSDSFNLGYTNVKVTAPGATKQITSMGGPWIKNLGRQATKDEVPIDGAQNW